MAWKKSAQRKVYFRQDQIHICVYSEMAHTCLTDKKHSETPLCFACDCVSKIQESDTLNFLQYA